MHALLILNEKAGTIDAARGEFGPDAFRAAFADAGATITVVTAAPGKVDAALRRGVADRAEAIFVGGGDGTVGAAATHLVGTDIPLGVLPLGTLNHFAKDLGVPPDWREAIPALVRAPVCSIDVGEVNGRIFINNCSLGLYADAVRRRDALRRREGHGKWWAMTIASWEVFRRLRRMRLEIATPRGVTPMRTPFVVVANNRYTGHVLDGCLRARLDEGRLWLHTTRAHRRFAMLRLVLQALRRRLGEVDHLETQPVTEATITTLHGPIPIAADGEPLALQPPLRFRIRPGALRVFAPAAPRPHENHRPSVGSSFRH